jgi:uncharacterized protein YprB with RNaseH-like and TPR domain
MSSWSNKLERVSFSNNHSPFGVANGPDSLDHRQIELDVGSARESVLPSDPGQRIDALRARIANILTRSMPAVKARPQPPPPRPFDIAVRSSVFAEDQTESGPVFVRTKKLSSAHRVGRAPIYMGQDANAPTLSLLALDPALAGVDPSRALYLDTETTGLSGGAGTVPFLIGLAWFDGKGGLVFEQLLLTKLGQERPMLERLAERMAAASMLVSYNGKSFDMPLLRARRVLSRQPALPDLPHLDLLHVARRVHRHRFTQMTLGRVESEVLGFERFGDIGGAEVSSRYWHFVRTNDFSALDGVLEHNQWDVVSLAALVGLYGETLGESAAEIIAEGGADSAGTFEPTGLSPLDWPGIARTFKRAGSLERAGRLADRAVRRGAGSEAVRARGEIAKARGDKAQALADFQSLLETVDDPLLRLELVKLYEHHAKAPLAALEVLGRGTRESEEAAARRRKRLEKKSRRPPQ